MKIGLTILMLFFTINLSYSQEKFEREYRIKQSEVPLKAIEFTEKSFENINLKWYGEENLDGKAIEAKGKKDGKLYSIKFDTNGNLQDIEMLIKYNTLSKDITNTIEKTLKALFSKFRIEKTQKQWVGSEAVLKSLIRGENVQGEYLTNYEIILTGTKDNRMGYYEVLLNEKGGLIRESKIIQRNDNHLIY